MDAKLDSTTTMRSAQQDLLAPDSKIYVAGHTGLFGSALTRSLRRAGFTRIVAKSHANLDLTDRAATTAFFEAEKPEAVFMAAALAGGIGKNRTKMADLSMGNLLMTCNLIEAAHKTGVRKLVYLGSACVYPVDAPQPICEESLLQGAFEPTNEGYAIAKAAGIKLCEYYRQQYGDNFLAVIPVNVYGPNDHFAGEGGHVIPMLLRKMSDAKEAGQATVEIWGTGNAEREFMYVDDAADACLAAMRGWNKPGPVNIGVGEMINIRQLAETIKKVVGYEGDLRFDHSKPDGMPRRLLDSSRIASLGFRARVTLEEGLARTWAWYRANIAPNAGTQENLKGSANA